MRLRHILLVHEQRSIRNVIKMLTLSDLTDVQIVEAQSKAEALVQLQHTVFDLILCGNEMTHDSGVDIFHAMQNMLQTQPPPFLLLTSLVNNAAFDRLRLAGIQHWLVTPFTAQTLVAKINELCDPRGWRGNKRMNVPGARGILHTPQGDFAVEPLNLSVGGLACDMEAVDNLNVLMRETTLSLAFPPEIGDGVTERIPCDLLQVHVLTRDSRLDPQRFRTIWTFRTLSPKDQTLLQHVFSILEKTNW